MSDKEITDPKLLKYIGRAGSLKSVTKPDLVKVREMFQKPNASIELNFDGVREKPEKELILTIYKCNKCVGEFNHTELKARSGVMPSCPNCDQ